MGVSLSFQISKEILLSEESDPHPEGCIFIFPNLKRDPALRREWTSPRRVCLYLSKSQKRSCSQKRVILTQKGVSLSFQISKEILLSEESDPHPEGCVCIFPNLKRDPALRREWSSPRRVCLYLSKSQKRSCSQKKVILTQKGVSLSFLISKEILLSEESDPHPEGCVFIFPNLKRDPALRREWTSPRRVCLYVTKWNRANDSVLFIL